MTRKSVKHIVSIKGADFEVNDNEVITTPYENIRIHTPWNYVSVYDAYKNRLTLSSTFGKHGVIGSLNSQTLTSALAVEIGRSLPLLEK